VVPEPCPHEAQIHLIHMLMAHQWSMGRVFAAIAHENLRGADEGNCFWDIARDGETRGGASFEVRGDGGKSTWGCGFFDSAGGYAPSRAFLWVQDGPKGRKKARILRGKRGIPGRGRAHPAPPYPGVATP
jgi:hypothetical protein